MADFATNYMNALVQGGRDAAAAQNRNALLDIQQQRLGMDRERLDMARQQAQQSMALALRDMDARTAAREAEQAIRLGSMFRTAHDAGDFTGMTTVAHEMGLPVDAVTPENVQQIMGTVLGGIDALQGWQSVAQKGGASAADLKIRRIMEGQGVDYKTAQGIADGVVAVSRDPETGEAIIIDKATGARVGEQPTIGAAPQEGPRLSFPDQGPIPGVADSYGVEGFAKGLANTVGGAVGAEPFPQVAEAQANLTVIGESISREIMNAYRRQPPKFIAEAIRSLFPEGGKPLLGTPQAQRKLQALRDQVARDIGANSNSLNSRRLSPKAKQDLGEQISAGSAALESLDRLLGSFGGKPSGTTSSGLNWSIE